ncbi:hypothetical protein ACT1U9_21090 [Streptomyces sp. BR1]|uniref:hypothetical protein n=1 Tax=Streptomyces sp. BR1 TaxID=1592323 RepID=UPI00402B7D2D
MPASRDEFPDLSGTATSAARLTCPACGSSHVAQMLGDDGGGVSYVCTACGHSWS